VFGRPCKNGGNGVTDADADDEAEEGDGVRLSLSRSCRCTVVVPVLEAETAALVVPSYGGLRWSRTAPAILPDASTLFLLST
jgi:hypothetical protein